jgi:hypothetical protein
MEPAAAGSTSSSRENVEEESAMPKAEYSATDMFRNRIAIFGQTLLSVCDPLYLAATLEQTIGIQLRPQTAADARGIPFRRLVVFPQGPVVA